MEKSCGKHKLVGVRVNANDIFPPRLTPLHAHINLERNDRHLDPPTSDGHPTLHFPGPSEGRRKVSLDTNAKIELHELRKAGSISKEQGGGGEEEEYRERGTKIVLQPGNKLRRDFPPFYSFFPYLPFLRPPPPLPPPLFPRQLTLMS
jgi:hypothetical protein